MLGNVNINFKPTTDTLTLATTAAFFDVQQYFNNQHNDIVDLRTYGYLINDSFLLTDYEETTTTTLTTHPNNSTANIGGHVVTTLKNIGSGSGITGSGAGTVGAGGVGVNTFNSNFNFITFNQSGLIKNETNDSDNSSRDGLDGVGLGIGGDEVLPMPEDLAVLLKMIIMSIVLGLMILITIIGKY